MRESLFAVEDENEIQSEFIRLGIVNPNIMVDMSFIIFAHETIVILIIQQRILPPGLLLIKSMAQISPYQD